MCHQRIVVQETPRVIEFQDADGDHWKFQVREDTLLETMNNETPLEIDWLEWDPQERTLSDYGRSFTFVCCQARYILTGC